MYKNTDKSVVSVCTVVITVVILFDEEKKENSNLLKYVPYWPQQNHIPDEFAVIKTNPAKALRNIAETKEELLICWKTLYTDSYQVEGM